LQDQGIPVIKIRLLLEELMEIKLASFLVPLPGRTTKYTPLQHQEFVEFTNAATFLCCVGEWFFVSCVL
jgi:hypothetical protein